MVEVPQVVLAGGRGGSGQGPGRLQGHEGPRGRQTAAEDSPDPGAVQAPPALRRAVLHRQAFPAALQTQPEFEGPTEGALEAVEDPQGRLGLQAEPGPGGDLARGPGGVGVVQGARAGQAQARRELQGLALPDLPEVLVPAQAQGLRGPGAQIQGSAGSRDPEAAGLQPLQAKLELLAVEGGPKGQEEQSSAMVHRSTPAFGAVVCSVAWKSGPGASSVPSKVRVQVPSRRFRSRRASGGTAGEGPGGRCRSTSTPLPRRCDSGSPGGSSPTGPGLG